MRARNWSRDLDPIQFRSMPSNIQTTECSSSQIEPLARLVRYSLLVLIFAAATGSFFKLGLGTYVWGLIYLGTTAVAIRDRNSILAAVTSSWPVLLFPVLCLVSVLWSIEYASTLRAAAQYLFTTIIALWIGSTFRLPTLYSALCIALLGCVLVSIAGTYFGVIDGFKQDDYVGAQRYFIGLYSQKNIMGNAIVYAALATLIVGATRNRRLLTNGLAIALLPPLVLTKSTTALLLYFAVLSYTPALWFIERIRFKALVLLSLLLITLVSVFVLIAADVDLVNQLFAVLGKDATLTGRTTIWSNGAEVFLDNIYLGVGYQAFWGSPAYANEVMQIRAAVLETISGFHSGYLETMVTLGVLGLLAYLLMVLYALVVTGRLVVQQTTASSLGALYIIVHIFSRTFTESALYGQHDLEFILLVALVVSAHNLLNKAGSDG